MQNARIPNRSRVVTTPNTIADEQTIVNFTRRQPCSDALPTESLFQHIKVTRKFSPEQVANLLHFSRSAISAIQGLQETLISLEEDNSEGCSLLYHALVAVQSWDQYIAARERIYLRLKEVVEQDHLTQRTIGVGYDTSIEQLDRIPKPVRDLVGLNPLLALRSFHLMSIAAFSYEYSFLFRASHTSLAAIKDAIDRPNKALLTCFAAEGIEIKYPTAVEIRKMI